MISFFSTCALLLGFGGTVHLGVISRKLGWFVMAAGISTTLAARAGLVYFGEELAGAHSVLMLAGITLLFRSYRQDIDELQALADSVPCLVWIAGPTGKITYINKQFSNFTGKPLREVQNYETSNLVHPEDLARVSALWESCTASGQVFESEHRMRGRDGTYRWFSCRATPVMVGAKVKRFFGQAFDINAAKIGLENLTTRNGH